MEDAGLTLDDLPDELLMRILAQVKDPFELLTVVPLVCKRWHAVHREPETWAQVRLEEYAAEDDEDAKWELVNILQRAPYVQYLSGDLLRSPEMFAAVASSGVVVEEYRQPYHHKYEFVRPERLPILLDMLYRSRHVIRVAEVELDNYGHERVVDSGGRNALEVLLSLKKLEELVVRGRSELPYHGELAQGLPCLKKLKVSECGLGGILDQVMSTDLIRGSKKLRCIKLVPVGCTGERTGIMRLQQECLKEAKNCPRLEAVELSVGTTDWHNSRRLAKYIRELLQTFEGFSPTLRRIDISVQLVWYGMREADDATYDRTLAACEEEATKLKRVNRALEITFACTQGHPEQVMHGGDPDNDGWRQLVGPNDRVVYHW
ncbi:uncharacterized protein LOC117644682 [Thrips palmi]|uniref:Uncharacterized protein LOC117644682 n=1 Tax=Thrips palmi TaxID=161013 RepID=A0A6P8YS41_THRPL|nr:uncharacterized protein LOC117644682 [Thrips palmi]